MLKVVQFEPKHLKELSLQPAQAYMSPQIMKPDYGTSFVEAGPAYTGIADGRVVVCAGVFEMWAGRGMAWALIADNIPHHFLSIHRAVRKFLVNCPIRRIEAYVDVGFEEAHQWADILGFTLETPQPMRGFMGNRDMYMYALIKE
jgi:hypothetical protein